MSEIVAGYHMHCMCLISSTFHYNCFLAISASFRQISRIHESPTDKRKVLHDSYADTHKRYPLLQPFYHYFEQTTAWRFGWRPYFYICALVVLKCLDRRVGLPMDLEGGCGGMGAESLIGGIEVVWRRKSEADCVIAGS